MSFIKFLKALFPNPALALFIMGCGAIAACVMLAYKLDDAEQRLLEANQTIQQYQQAQKLAESAQNKLSEHNEAFKNEALRQSKIVNEALENNSSWADQLLPDSVRSMFGTAEATATNPVPSTSGVAQ